MTLTMWFLILVSFLVGYLLSTICNFVRIVTLTKKKKKKRHEGLGMQSKELLRALMEVFVDIRKHQQTLRLECFRKPLDLLQQCNDTIELDLMFTLRTFLMELKSTWGLFQTMKEIGTLVEKNNAQRK